MLPTVAAVAAQAADALTFLWMVSIFGIGAELNPLVRHAGPALAVAMKIALMVFIASLSHIIRYRSSQDVERRHLALRVVVVVATVVGLVGAVSNIHVVIGSGH